jgi:hypothetical protein
MTDNITKLYEIAGVEIPKSLASMCWAKEVLFTAEKQLELIKWVATKQGYITIGYDSDYGYDCEVVNSNDCYESFCYYEPEYALCGLIIDLWKDLTDEQKAEVKRILE